MGLDVIIIEKYVNYRVVRTFICLSGVRSVGFMRNLNPIQGLIIINFLQTPNKIMFIAPSVFWNPPIFYYLAIPSI